MSRTRRTRQALADVVQHYRLMARLSQRELAELSFRLAEQGVITSPMHRTQIQRIEAGQKPQPATMYALSHTLSAALMEAGYHMTGDDVYRHLSNTDRLKLTTRHVSPRAAELDAILAPLHEDWAEPEWDGLIAHATAYIEGLRRTLSKRRADRSKSQGGSE